MKNKTAGVRTAALWAGLVLVAVSAALLIASVTKGSEIKAECDDVVAHMEQILPGRQPGAREERLNNTLPAISYNGQNYSLLLSVPAFSVKLPVRASWNRSAVRNVPCVFTGNPYEGTLIIGGTDSAGQFDFVPGIDIGDKITVTDMNGHEFTYTVAAVKHAKNAKAKTLTDAEYDLTLFAKDKTGDWLLVRCH